MPDFYVLCMCRAGESMSPRTPIRGRCPEMPVHVGYRPEPVRRARLVLLTIQRIMAFVLRMKKIS